MATPILIYLEPSELPIYGINEKALKPIPVDRQEAAIAAACRRFDSYIRGRVIFPLVQVGEDVKECVAILATFSLMAVRGFSADGSADEVLLTRYEQMETWLKLIADGKAFPDVTGSAPGDTQGRPSSKPRAMSSSQQGWSNRGTTNGRGPFTND